jgi:predicted short-subunit dehydrogenase-like oxidoreductase (DUF2520 family)
MKLKIGFIGSGNVARHLSRALKTVGHDVIQIISRNKTTARALAKELGCSSTADITKLSREVELCIICVSDDQLALVASQIPTSDRIVVHTCGSQSINVLDKTGNNYGVLYPLQTFSIDRKPDISTVPFILESSNPETLIVLHAVASSLTHYVINADSETRLKYHLSAVLVNNFVNHLYREAESFLETNELDFNVLKPIILETALKVQNLSPDLAQTGPANRGDEETIQKHLDLLISDKHLRSLYSGLSDDIKKDKSH